MAGTEEAAAIEGSAVGEAKRGDESQHAQFRLIGRKKGSRR